MSWTLLAPASAIILTVVVLTWSLYRVEVEIAQLRQALRRSQVTAVATDDLSREAQRVAASAADLETVTRRRAELRRNQRQSRHR